MLKHYRCKHDDVVIIKVAITHSKIYFNSNFGKLILHLFKYSLINVFRFKTEVWTNNISDLCTV